MLLRNAYQHATDIINEHRDKLDMIAEHLLIEETIDGRDVEEIIEHGRVFSEEEREAAAEANKTEDEKSQDNAVEIVEHTEKKVDTEADSKVKEDVENA